jgi:hypothetical protein
MNGWTRPQLFWTMLSHCQRMCGAHVADARIRGAWRIIKTTIDIHLYKNGFVLGYKVQKFNSESSTRVVAEDEHDCDAGNVDRMDEMLETIQADVTKDAPTTEVEAFFKVQKSRCMNTQK